MSYKIKLKFISKNSQPVPNLYYEASIGRTVFSKGYSHQKSGESRVFEVRGTVTHLQVSKEPNNTIQLLNLRPILHRELTRDKVNEVTIIVPVKIISLLLEKEKEGTYQRSSRSSSTYTIQPGENLEGIAKRHNLDVDDLAKRNGISDKNNIKVGQEINLNNVKKSPFKVSSPQIIYPSITFHIVQKGESLLGISKKYGVSIDDLKNINSLDNSTISINQKLFIKSSEKIKDKNRKLANFIILISILDSSRQTKRPITTVTGEGTKQFYISLSGQVALGLGVGGSVQVGTATDKRGNVGVFITLNGQAVTAGTPGVALDGGVVLTKAKSINELAGLGYSAGGQVHLLGGSGVAVGDDGSVDISAGVGIGANSSVGAGYTFVIPLN